jgi:hypothetical protein
MEYTDTVHYKKNLLKQKNEKRPHMKQAVSDEQPKYMFLMTEPFNMKMLLAALMPVTMRSQYYHWYAPTLPSSTLFFEVVENTDGSYVLNLLFNDKPVPVG